MTRGLACALLAAAALGGCSGDGSTPSPPDSGSPAPSAERTEDRRGLYGTGAYTIEALPSGRVSDGRTPLSGLST